MSLNQHPVEFSFLYTTRSSLDLTFKQTGHVKFIHSALGRQAGFCRCEPPGPVVRLDGALPTSRVVVRPVAFAARLSADLDV